MRAMAHNGSVIVALCSAVAVLAHPAMAQIPCRYELTAVIQGPWCNQIFEYPPTFVDGLGADGRVVGHYQSCDIGPDRAFLWSAESGMTVLPRPPGFPGSRAFDIDSKADWVVGSLIADPDGSLLPLAALWVNGVPQTLGIPPGGNYSEAVAVANGWIAGTWGNNAVGPIGAFLWQEGAMFALDLPMGPNSKCADVNQSGAVVGWMGDSFLVDSHAFLSQDGTTTDLGVVPGGFTGYAMAVNNADPAVVVGSGQVPWKGNPFGMPRAFWWSNGTMIALPSPGGGGSHALDISDNGVAVGVTDYGASIWHDGAVMNL
jgi:probable HAF family extracellular repeat protein